MDINTSLDELLAYAKERLMLDELDEIYARNTVLGILRAGGYRPGDPDTAKAESAEEPSALVDALVSAAVAAGMISSDEAERAGKRILEAIALRPSAVNDMYAEAGGASSAKAKEFLDDYVRASGFGASSNPAFIEEIADDGARRQGDGRRQGRAYRRVPRDRRTDILRGELPAARRIRFRLCAPRDMQHPRHR